jgi:class 3 adenylate cyclase
VTTLVAAWEPCQAGSAGVRAGLVYGSVTSRHGDYFGSAVDLAARLVALAPRHLILVDNALAHRLSPGAWRLGTVEELTYADSRNPLQRDPFTLQPTPKR